MNMIYEVNPGVKVHLETFVVSTHVTTEVSSARRIEDDHDLASIDIILHFGDTDVRAVVEYPMSDIDKLINNDLVAVGIRVFNDELKATEVRLDGVRWIDIYTQPI